jgi:cysteine synthase B
MPNQYENDANFMSHYSTTAPEIWSQTGGRITHFVAGVGTGGTLTGVGSYIKERKENARIIAVQPEKRHRIQGLRNLEVSAMPALLKRRASVIDEWLTVSDRDSFAEVARLARSTDILVGPSSGAVLAGLRQLSLKSGVVTVVFGDDGSKYKELYRELGIFGESELDRLLAQRRDRAYTV